MKVDAGRESKAQFVGNRCDVRLSLIPRDEMLSMISTETQGVKRNLRIQFGITRPEGLLCIRTSVVYVPCVDPQPAI